MEPTLSKPQQALLEAGVNRFDEARYWDAHEEWEDLWKQLKSGECELRYVLALQGLIQCAALLHQYQRKNLRGVANMWDKCTSKLGLPSATSFDTLWGLEVDRLIEELQVFAIAAADEEWSLQLNQIKINHSWS